MYRINHVTYDLIGSVYDSVKEKEPWCDNVSAVTEIAVFTPEAVIGSSREFPASIRGFYRMLEEAHYQFDIIDQYMDFSKYKLIILPDIITMDESREPIGEGLRNTEYILYDRVYM